MTTYLSRRLSNKTALQLLTSPAWPKHLRRVCRALELRRDAMVDAIHEFLPGIKLPFLPRGGLHLWVRLPNQIDEARLVQRAKHAGVIVIRGRNWFPADAPGPHLSLTYAAERGEVLVAEGSRPSGLLLVVRGAAEVMVTQRGSTHRVRLAGPGRFVGHNGILDDEPSPVVARCRERSALLAFPPATVKSLLSDSARAARAFSAAVLEDTARAVRQASRPVLSTTTARE